MITVLRHFTIATGSLDGAYYKFGKAYSAILQKYGITLEVIRTAGSAENLQLLSEDDGGVDLAFLQGGIRPSGRSDDIISIESLYDEPLWIFQVQPSLFQQNSLFCLTFLPYIYIGK